jgi:hypothetical protein
VFTIVITRCVHAAGLKLPVAANAVRDTKVTTATARTAGARRMPNESGRAAR